MKKKNIEYCVYCGTKNKIENKKCNKCHKKLNSKDKPLLEYLKSKIKDDLKGNLEDNIIDIIIKYIKTHLYGFIMTCSIIITTTCVIKNITDNSYIQTVTEKPSLVLSVTNTCVFNNYVIPVGKCNDGYKLDGEICIKKEETPAIMNKVCPNGYYQDGNSCISNMTYNKIIKEECLLPDDGAISVSIAETGECVATYCSEWNGEECTAGGGQEIEYTPVEYCPDGTTAINGACRRTSNTVTEYRYDKGSLNNDKCIITTEEEPYPGCEEGYILNEECKLCVIEES